MKLKIFKVILLCIFFVTAVTLGYSFSKISDIEVEHTSSNEVLLASDIKTCVVDVLGKVYWAAARDINKEVLAQCDPVVIGHRISYKFPRIMVIILETIRPVVKREVEDGCVLIQSSAVTLSSSAMRCSLYEIPTLTLEKQEVNAFIMDYSVEVVKEFSNHNLEVVKITYKGEPVAPWYVIELQSKKSIYLPASSVISEKVAILIAAIKGLNDAEEPYSVIDLRFDRVIYK